MAGEQLPHDAFLQDVHVTWEPGTAALRFGFEKGQSRSAFTGCI